MYPVEGSVIATQSTNANWSGHRGTLSAQGMAYGWTPPSGTVHCIAQASAKGCIMSSKQKHNLCAKNFKKLIRRPSAGPIPGGDFTQHDLGWQDWSFKASQMSLA